MPYAFPSSSPVRGGCHHCGHAKAAHTSRLTECIAPRCPCIGYLSPYEYKRHGVAKHEGRLRLLEHVWRRPGQSFSELRDATGLGFGQTQYHLRRLETAGLVRSVRAGRARLHFPWTGRADVVRLMRLTGVLRHPVAARVLRAVCESPGASQAKIADRVPGRTRQDVAYHLQRLRT